MTYEPLIFDVDYAISLYEAGESLDEVGRKMGVSGNTVGRRMDAAGLKRRSHGVSTALRYAHGTPDLDPFFERYKAGEGRIALAREAGVGGDRFLRLMREAGIPIRDLRGAVAMRYTRMSKSEREGVTQAANTAKRGKRANPESLARRALTMEATLQLASRADLILAVWLAQRGVEFTPQKAVGPYNVDIAVHEPRVAVEVDGFHHAPELRRLSRSRSTPAERREYLFDRGWRLIEVRPPMSTRENLSPLCADHIVALLEEARADEPSWGEYCVVGGDGELCPGDGTNGDDIA